MILPADKNDGVVLDDSEREGLLLQGALDFMEVRHKGRVCDLLPLAFNCLCASRSSLTLLALRCPLTRFDD